MATTKEIKDEEIIRKTNSFIIALAKFAVNVHNRRQGAHLVFKKVVKVTQEAVVEGAIYDITIQASNLHGVEQSYEAKVWVNNSTSYKELLEFSTVANINENPAYIIDLAKFAVQIYNQEQNAHLEFEIVEKESAKLAGGGVNYDITFGVNNGGLQQHYEAKIWVREMTGDKYLLEFNLVQDHHNIDEIIISLAKFAVQINNQIQDAGLEFESVVKSKIEPCVEGVIYYITLEACNIKGLKQLYEAKVWVNEATNYKELLAFKHVVKNST